MVIVEMRIKNLMEEDLTLSSATIALSVRSQIPGLVR